MYKITHLKFKYAKKPCETIFIDELASQQSFDSSIYSSTIDSLYESLKNEPDFELSKSKSNDITSIKCNSRLELTNYINEFSKLKADQSIKDLIILKPGISWFISSNEVFGDLIIPSFYQKGIPIKVSELTNEEKQQFIFPPINL